MYVNYNKIKKKKTVTNRNHVNMWPQRCWFHSKCSEMLISWICLSSKMLLKIFRGWFHFKHTEIMISQERVTAEMLISLEKQRNVNFMLILWFHFKNTNMSTTLICLFYCSDVDLTWQTAKCLFPKLKDDFTTRKSWLVLYLENKAKSSNRNTGPCFLLHTCKCHMQKI